MSAERAREAVRHAEHIAEHVLRPHAAAVDRENRFPHESIRALKDAGLFGWFVPKHLGGWAGDVRSFCEIASHLGEGCLSSAIIWSMHCQQVAILARHSSVSHCDVLADVARNQLLVASVTSEYARDGSLLTAYQPLIQQGDQIRVVRAAPFVSYGREATYYLLSMCAGIDRPRNDVRLVLIKADDGVTAISGSWRAMGMRGTQTVPMKFDATVELTRVLPPHLGEIASRTMIPIGHVGWVACWYGAARGALKRYVRGVRRERMGHEARLSNLIELARLRANTDLVENLLFRVVDDFERLDRAGAPLREYNNANLVIRLNNLKIAGSTLSFQLIDGLVELAGVREGYLEGGEQELERIFRDLRSASLMYHNKRLLEANARLLVVDSLK